LDKLNVYRSSFFACIDQVGYQVDNILYWLEKTWGAVGECSLFEIKVILNELLSNAVKHGSKNGYINISAHMGSDDFIFVEVEDDGEGYDYNGLLMSAERSSSCGDIFSLKETGRGLLIVKSLCNSLQFNKKGNKVAIRKELFKT